MDPRSTTEDLKSSLPIEIRKLLEFEELDWATGSVLEDPFYSIEGSDFASAAPGKLLKIERAINTWKHALPPATTMSRFVFQSKSLNGSLVPVSAYVLWPSSPRYDVVGGDYQMVVWAHGTGGTVPNSAPSHLANLWQHHFAPLQLVLQGYVVVAPDYAGLGISKGYGGQPITHEYMASPAQANDIVYSVQAAREAFPRLNRFVVVGHSQGGSAAWPTAGKETIDGYLGSVAISPVTNILSQPDPLRSIIIANMTPGIAAKDGDFKATDLLTEEGRARGGPDHRRGSG